MITVVYPYIEKAAEWEELRYSLRSLEKHFQEPFEVLIIGDLPDWAQNVRHIAHQRVDGIEFTNCYDICRKMQTVIDSPQVSDHFLYMYDDIYLIKNLSRGFFYDLYAVEVRMRDESTVHRKLMWRTFDTLKHYGFPQFNFETHMPRFFSKQIMREVFSFFNPKDNRLLFNTLYYNRIAHDRQAHPTFINRKIKAGFYDADNDYSYPAETEQQVRKAIEGKYFLNHDNHGLTPPLMDVIKSLFPNKSRFEK